MRRVALLSTVLLGMACDDGAPETPSSARIVVLSVTDPVVGTDPVELGVVLFLSTRAGQAWLLDDTGRQLTDRVWVGGGEIARIDVEPLELEPGDNRLELRLAPDSGGVTLTARVVLTLDAECTRSTHCGGGRCVDFHCE